MEPPPTAHSYQLSSQLNQLINPTIVNDIIPNNCVEGESEDDNMSLFLDDNMSLFSDESEEPSWKEDSQAEANLDRNV